MKLKIKEMIVAYNDRHDDRITMRDVALKAWRNKDTIEQTKINRLSALNTGKAMATIREAVKIADILDCSLTNLIEYDTETHQGNGR